jgi:hypothetical protein
MLLCVVTVVEKMDKKRPNLVYALIMLWIILSGIFIAWGEFSLIFVSLIPNWPHSTLFVIDPLFYFGAFLSMITWFFFSCLLFIFSYGTFKRASWAWTTGIIISTIFIILLGLMLASFIVTAIIFPNLFSVAGLSVVILALLTDLGIVFCITRPTVKIYFDIV